MKFCGFVHLILGWDYMRAWNGLTGISVGGWFIAQNRQQKQHWKLKKRHNFIIRLESVSVLLSHTHRLKLSLFRSFLCWQFPILRAKNFKYSLKFSTASLLEKVLMFSHNCNRGEGKKHEKFHWVDSLSFQALSFLMISLIFTTKIFSVKENINYE
jgi:hypothetical protein